MDHLKLGNDRYIASSDAGLRASLAENGQHPRAVVITCSDSRVIPEAIFDAGLGELFVIRVAGNVLGPIELGSVEYAVEHLGCPEVIMLGHTGCGAVGAALSGHCGPVVQLVLKAIGTERNADRAARLNVLYGTRTLQRTFPNTAVHSAIYDLRSGRVEWLQAPEADEPGRQD